MSQQEEMAEILFEIWCEMESVRRETSGKPFDSRFFYQLI